MALNIGNITARSTPEHQEMYTPYYGVKPIMKYIPKEKKIWTPFDLEWSAFYRSFVERGACGC